MSMRTPLSRVRGLGSAREGTGHFWVQRLTGLALAVLTTAFIVLIVALAGRPYPDVARVLGNPFVALLMILMVGAGAWHMKIGMQVIIEDYLHGHAKLIAQIANSFFSVAVAVASALALLKLSFGV
ncbi:succinate dehydrogenase / fumarate reductase membrane anchor subunit [Kaistia soli DSM 19436]|uniref:Succinate dehydrogenase hydrophobic membrane anchor subunit n=2 Tax=Kaistia TaxID=166953 RepID=A0A1M5N4M1_9HYPH|nr:succinate dehydrogenase / fumarate reductase membrane anchor subunit [Kaistia soli DSM 19436]